MKDFLFSLAIGMFTFILSQSVFADDLSLVIDGKKIKMQGTVARIPNNHFSDKSSSLHIDLYLEELTEEEKKNLSKNLWTPNDWIKKGVGKTRVASLMFKWAKKIETCDISDLNGLTLVLYPNLELGVVTKENNIHNLAFAVNGRPSVGGLKISSLNCKFTDNGVFKAVITGSKIYSLEANKHLIEWNFDISTTLMAEPDKETANKAYLDMKAKVKPK